MDNLNMVRSQLVKNILVLVFESQSVVKNQSNHAEEYSYHVCLSFVKLLFSKFSEDRVSQMVDCFL